MQRIQQLAADALEQVDAGRTLTEALAAAMHSEPPLTPQERAALQDICYGTIRRLAALRLMLRQLVPNRLPSSFVESLLTVALFQLFHTRAADYAIVNEAVTLAGRHARGRYKSLVNGVLRNALRRRAALEQAVAADEEAASNHPRWWLAFLRSHYPDQWQSIVEVDNAHPPMTLRVNRRRSDGAAYRRLLAEAGIESEALDDTALMLASPVPVRELPGFADGLASVQDWGAQRAAALLAPADGMRVLDACAAPGGKSCHLLELADIDLTALDVDAARLARVGENLERLGLSAHLKTGDAGCPANWWDGRPYDRILADVPCSATGVVRRNPDIRWLRRAGDFARLARQQAAIVDALWPLLASGGKMLYATCSIHPEENQRQLASFLQRQGDARCLLQEQLLPTERHDGFYYALLEKP